MKHAVQEEDDTMSIRKAMQARSDRLAAIIEPYCDEHLNEDHKVLCLHVLEKQCRKRPFP